MDVTEQWREAKMPSSLKRLVVIDELSWKRERERERVRMRQGRKEEGIECEQQLSHGSLSHANKPNCTVSSI